MGSKRILATHRQRWSLRWVPRAIPLPRARDHRVTGCTYGSLWETPCHWLQTVKTTEILSHISRKCCLTGLGQAQWLVWVKPWLCDHRADCPPPALRAKPLFCLPLDFLMSWFRRHLSQHPVNSEQSCWRQITLLNKFCFHLLSPPFGNCFVRASFFTPSSPQPKCQVCIIYLWMTARAWTAD